MKLTVFGLWIQRALEERSRKSSKCIYAKARRRRTDELNKSPRGFLLARPSTVLERISAHHDPIPPCKIEKSSYNVPLFRHWDGVCARVFTPRTNSAFSSVVNDRHSRRSGGCSQVCPMGRYSWTIDPTMTRRTPTIATIYRQMYRISFLDELSWDQHQVSYW